MGGYVIADIRFRIWDLLKGYISYFTMKKSGVGRFEEDRTKCMAESMKLRNQNSIISQNKIRYLTL